MKRRDTIVRYTAPERINHWITAFCFILAAVSGLGFLFPSFNWFIMFFRYWHHNLINRDDIFWAKNIRKIVVNEEVGDTGRYNFGQKCVFWAAIIFLVLLLVSGVIIWRPYFAPAFSIPVIRFALMLHSFAAVALIVVIMVHIYAALWVKGTITAMVEGWVTSAWAKKHHPRWYREVRKTTEKKAE
ncbi:MAG: formate dehydrogenase subunit gamma [Escherichia coli]|nr:formate dehydrogenase subunit gamma [Escherichia coli]